MLLLAVLEKRVSLKLNSSDAYLNVIGGLTINETAADLAAILAIASSYLDRPVGDDLAAIGEVGLTGELRSVSGMEQRLAEVRRLGFQKCIVPLRSKGPMKLPQGLTVVEANTIRDALSSALGPSGREKSAQSQL
jgi:DNA repair protein RadA/Sms